MTDLEYGPMRSVHTTAACEPGHDRAQVCGEATLEAPSAACRSSGLPFCTAYLLPLSFQHFLQLRFTICNRSALKVNLRLLPDPSE